jgi:Cof subfamily protein (haloacid dehalogenase superfamily)
VSNIPTIKLVAIDLDGTLLNDRKEVTEETVASLSRAVDRGLKVVIASARPPRSVRGIYRRLGLDTLQVNYNGALIWDEPNRAVFSHVPLDGATVTEVVVFARQRHPGVLVGCEIMDRWHTDRHDEAYTTQTGRMFPPDVIAPVETFCSSPVTKLMLLGSPGVIADLRPVIEQTFAGRIMLTSSDEDLIQIAHPTVSKGAALKTVADYYEINMANVLAIGDAPNDVPMLTIAGVGVAMDNAHHAAKAAATWVAPSNNDHGVCATLRKYGACG